MSSAFKDILIKLSRIFHDYCALLSFFTTVSGNWDRIIFFGANEFD
jgi:hypothetical protein